MASEDSRYRDRCLGGSFARSSGAIPRSPLERCAPACIIAGPSEPLEVGTLRVLSGCSSKNGTTRPTRSSRRFTEKRRSTCRWSSGGAFDDAAAPEHLERSSSAGLEDAAWVTANSCWTCQPNRHPGCALPRSRSTFAVDEADDPLLDTWPFLLIDRTGRIVTAHCPRSTNRV